MVDLTELVEDVGEDVWGDANTGIAYVDPNLALDSLGGNLDLALIGVLDGITGQIEQDLAQPHLVAHNQREVLREIDSQGQTLRRRERCHALAHCLNNWRQRYRRGCKLQLTRFES